MSDRSPAPTSRLPAVLAEPTMVRAAVGPPAIVATGVGVGIGALDHSLIIAVVLGAVGWCGRMGWAAVSRARRNRPVVPPPVDPWSVARGWREPLQAAVDAQARFEGALASLPDGPARDRVHPLAERIDRSVRLAATTAQRGELLTGRDHARRVGALSAELTELGQRQGGDAERRHEEVVATQMRALRRAEGVAAEARDQVSLLAARIDEAVAALVELSLDRTRGGLPGSGAEPLVAVLDEIEALRVGLETSNGALVALPVDAPTAEVRDRPMGAGDP